MKATKWAILTCLLGALGAPVLTAQGEVKSSRSEAVAPATEAQTQAIARLIKVWNFVKYRHADALTGRLAMDPEFFTLYPQERAAASLAESDAILAGPRKRADRDQRDKAEIANKTAQQRGIADVSGRKELAHRHRNGRLSRWR